VGRLFKRLIVAGLVVFIVIQFVGPARTNPASDPNKAITKTVAVPRNVQAILDRSCRDCHTNGTTWPWYSHVAPMSWGVISHVNDGRGSMNFSDWPEGPEEAGELLDEVCKQVRQDKMPIDQYLWLHADARLSDADKKALCDWANDAASKLY
jgi:hypothetical protein